MVILPAGQGRSLASESHQAREIAESFGTEAERYARTRPAYPSSLVDAIAAATPGLRLLDVGIGTGISAQPFHQRGWHVLGVEPDGRMAQVARRSGLEVEIATFEQWDPAARTFDLVIAGQAWHWVNPVTGAAKAAQILNPGGRIALFWNAMTFPAELVRAFASVYRQVLPDFPFFQRGTPSYAPLTDKAATGIRQANQFSDPEHWEFEWSRSYSTAEWLDVVPTFGGHSHIPPEKLTELLAGIGHTLDAAGGSFTMTYNALVVTATRTSGQNASSAAARP